MLPRLIRSHSPHLVLLSTLFLFSGVACETETSDSLETSQEFPTLPEDSTETGNTADAAIGDTLNIADTVPQSTDTECIPDCEAKLCGLDGCGTLCGVCDEGFKCTSEQTCDWVCAPKESTLCLQSDVYWVNSCGAMEDLKETCSEGTQCTDGACVPCILNDDVACSDNNRIAVDSCGNPGETLGPCGMGTLCFEGECVNSESKYSGVFTTLVVPETLPLGVDDLEAIFPGGTVIIVADGSGVLEIAIGEDMLVQVPGMPSFQGTLSVTQIMAGSSYTEEVEGHTIEHSLIFNTLFISEDLFQGTLKDWVVVDGEMPPIELIRDITGNRVASSP